ncbi:TPA: YjeJ family protein [Klebsiella pneumoniae]|uniref:YjeJ family protein n=1 Tax=Klebsiella pneumoniae TaxID=573 RepID=UPI000E2BB4D8|nr:YjeJ family protein [Klebsiella pneumoniae]HDU4101166.1 hypothetical protein [Klebsiella pneumoniae subsp. pneumoniae]HEP0716644.1 hypothetical protein [Klebsiella pneumoniae subsp. ozaenae]MDM7331323.1 YjeJ family protein [Klebsiella pneumoniae]RRF65842.1 hypothetical protein EAO11_16865 [Klebsiella pneumoniae]TYW85889.1 hypothetical protein FCG69_023490 [Klebsiella pneumoniae]
MQGTFISFNTAGITFEERFLALLLKVKQKNGQCQTYYLQAPVLADLLTILQYRLLRTFQRLQEQGDSYKEELIACNESLMASIPEVDMAEIQQPDPEKRIMSIVPKFGESDTTLILTLQNEHICTLCIEDKQVEAMTLAINQSLKVADDQTVIQYISSSMDFLMCYAVDLTTQPNIDYQQYPQEEWKLNLFSHYLGVLYCCETDEGKKIVSGAVVKTSAPHLSELENNVVTRLIEKSPKLKAMHAELAPCQIFSTIIPSQPGRMLSLEECLRPLHAFYLEKKAELSA